MTPEQRRRLAELAAADRLRRAEAEMEIARKEEVLAAEEAKLAALNAANNRLEAELDAIRAEPADAPPAGPLGGDQDAGR